MIQEPPLCIHARNEYGGPGGSKGGEPDYLQWAVDMARTATTDVPWLLCHDVDQCTAVNTDNSTGTPAYKFKALCAINGFWMDEYNKDTHQPCPAWIRTLQQGNPGQPIIWTEDQGWARRFVVKTVFPWVIASRTSL